MIRDIAGAAANLIVEWVAEEALYEPIVEAVMVARGGTGHDDFRAVRDEEIQPERPLANQR